MMKLKRNCIFFNAKIEGSATADWGHELGQSHNNGYLMSTEGCSEIINGLVFNQVKNYGGFSYGRGGEKDNKEIEIISVFNDVNVVVYDVEKDTQQTHVINSPYILIIVKETSATSHPGRRTLKMNIGFSYNNIENKDFYEEINSITENPWFAYSLSYDNLRTGILTLTIIKAPQPNPIEGKPNLVYRTSKERKDIWNELVNNYSIKYETLDGADEHHRTFQTNNAFSQNIIYFGSPGTGKSYEVNQLTNNKNVKKVTFHPEYDYSSFVGGYKPSMEGTDISYKFVPQIFTNIYVEAWKNPDEHHFLQIEEINRGNCAEIFGDLFQLLDRADDGSSEYDVDASEELQKYLIEQLEEGHEGIANGKIKLPKNLSLVATMNTSDQSLFPMDSAFKRRWDWKYVGIDYDESNPSSEFIIELDNDNRYKWLDFLKAVNEKIVKATESSDKQLGNWFVKPKNNNITEEMFINKVLFYLWNDVFKDEEENIFTLNVNDELKTFGYEDFFTENVNSSLLVKLMEESLSLEKIEESSVAE